MTSWWRDPDLRLAVTLRLFAAVFLSAVVGLVLPAEVMRTVSRDWLGLEAIPTGDLSEYLTRFSSLCAAFYGAILLFLSFDVRRYRPLVRFLAVSGLPIAGVMAVADSRAGMPAWWTWGECGSILATSAVLWLAARGGVTSSASSPPSSWA